MKKKIIAIVIGIGVLAAGCVCAKEYQEYQEYEARPIVCYYGCPNSKRVGKLNLKKGIKK